jgi:hypothetical protein
MRPLNRIDPVGTAYSYKTYAIASPISTHYRDGTCDEFGCLAQRNGWKTVIDESTALGQRQAHYIRHDRRKFTETRTEAGLTEFAFEAGQKCFATHKVPLERPEFFGVLGGDYRLHDNRWGVARQQGQLTVHTKPTNWVDDFATHQERLSRVVNG